MKRFCTSLQGDEVQTALVVGQGYLFRHSANERSHSHKRCEQDPDPPQLPCSTAVTTKISRSISLYRDTLIRVENENKSIVT